MITEKDLQEAIAECQGVRKPNADTCIKLASFYIILREMYGKEKEQEEPAFTYNQDIVNYYSDTEFGKAIEGKEAGYIWEIMDEAMSTIQIINPNLYNGIMRKLDY